MNKVLTQDEIDSLLLGGGATTFDTSSHISNSGESAALYNFRRPDRVSKEQIHSLQFLHERFARNVSTSLSAYLRTITEFAVVSVEQFSYSEFLMSLSDPTAFYALALSPHEDLGSLEINPAIAFAVVDRMLGGSGGGAAPSRALSDIEQNVIDAVVRLMLENLSDTWRAISPIHFSVRARETRPQMLQVSGPNEVVVMLAFDVRIGSARGMMNLCLPSSLIETVGEHFGQAWTRQRRESNDVERTWIREHLQRVPIELVAQIDARLRTSELVTMSRGDILVLGVSADAPIELRVGPTPKFTGRLTRHGAHVGVRIERRIDPGQGGLT